MIYLNTSVLLAFTLTRETEPARFTATSQLFARIEAGSVKAITSFYALHELLIIAISNTEPDWETGSEFARQALLAILQTPLLYLPLSRREDKLIQARRFSKLRDATDLSHAVAAYVAGCSAIIAYDDHFQAIADAIPYKTPEKVVAELAR